MKVEIVTYSDLAEHIRDEMPTNGVGAEDANYLMVELRTNKVVYYSDAMEPEDATFTRDLSWIKDALFDAYNFGVMIGYFRGKQDGE